jgi:ABC-type nitrate/sulfonate/bicarbonate transport system ATPase subunit
MKKIAIDDVHVEFTGNSDNGRREVLTGINMDIHEGETLSVLGKSGCGKTTLLNVIGGLLKPKQGSVFICSTGEGPPVIRYVFQKFSLYPWMNVVDNIRIGLPDGKKDNGELKRVIELVGLSDCSHQKAMELSGGMAQRVALARALVSKPDIMLLDEPFSALDAFTKLKLQEEVFSILKKEGITTVLVTHDIDEAIYFGDRVVVMSDEGNLHKFFTIHLHGFRDRNSPDFFDIREKIYREFHLSVPKPQYYQI